MALVPTMGALHRGHLSLVRRARAECDAVVVSVFVNPLQFGPGEDLDRYPRPLEADLALLRDEAVDSVFVPSVEAMYPAGSSTTVRLEGPLVTGLEGAHRPGHFDGVATVVTKLLIAARPDRLYIGQKDAQQCAVISRLAADLDTGVEVVVCPTVREASGLALSSRNAYLDAEQRRQALAIPSGLAAAVLRYDAGEREVACLVAAVEEELMRSPLLQPDYVAVVDPGSFIPVARARPNAQLVVAGKMPAVRLLDTVTLGVDRPPLVVPEALAVAGRGREQG
ncbi:MAG: hypothetical protein NVSMB29_10790 [Candidatus Dormibacteria bacterium]